MAKWAHVQDTHGKDPKVHFDMCLLVILHSLFCFHGLHMDLQNVGQPMVGSKWVRLRSAQKMHFCIIDNVTIDTVLEA